MISLNINVSRSGKDEIPTHGEDVNLNKRIFVDDVDNLIIQHMLCYGGVDYDEVVSAIKTIIVYFATQTMYGLTVDVNKLEYEATPKKKMTKKEIEKALGYPIEIVKENK